MRFFAGLRAWLADRQHCVLPVRLGQQRIYILPTKAGLVLGVLVAAMLVASINYTNNLAFLLTFLVASMAVVSAIHCHATLLGLEITHVQQRPVFCGTEAVLQIGMQAAGQARRMLRVGVGPSATTCTLEKHGRAELHLAVPTVRRGLMPIRPVVVSTRSPLGLFRAWSTLVFPVQGLIYPWPRIQTTGAATVSGAADESGTGVVAMSGEFLGVRPYRPEDGMARVAWKASARGMGLFAREYGMAAASSCVFDWWTCLSLGYEERISHLAGLVQEAEHMGLRYGLRIPGTELAPGSGPGHAHACLKALALLPEQA
ncbi:DUF58 domain-containing protein [Desulfovibrionales bacterium]